ncbi:MAG: hypothetical protein WAX04_03075 [Oscillospiraceae bacterium]
MYKNLLVVVLLAVILAMAVPFTMYIYQIENAFTYDNVINGSDYGKGANLP